MDQANRGDRVYWKRWHLQGPGWGRRDDDRRTGIFLSGFGAEGCVVPFDGLRAGSRGPQDTGMTGGQLGRAEGLQNPLR